MTRRAPDAALVLLVAILTTGAGCARRERPALEPEGTVTRTWVGEARPQPAPEVEPPSPAPTTAAPAEQVPEDIVPEGDAEVAQPAPKSPENPPPTRRGWVKGGSWNR